MQHHNQNHHQHHYQHHHRHLYGQADSNYVFRSIQKMLS